MEVITIESTAFKKLEYLLERNNQLSESIFSKEVDRILTIAQAAEYVGVDRRWIDARKKKIGCFKEGRIIRIRKSAIDKYLEKYTIHTKKP